MLSQANPLYLRLYELLQSEYVTQSEPIRPHETFNGPMGAKIQTWKREAVLSAATVDIV